MKFYTTIRGLFKLRERGLTFPEALVIAGMVATLALIITVALQPAKQTNMASVCESNLRTIATAAESYSADVGSYPPAGSSGVVDASLFQNPITGRNYLPQPPVDPTAPAGSYTYALTTGAGVSPFFQVACPGNHSSDALTQVSGATATSSKIYYDSRKNIYTQ